MATLGSFFLDDVMLAVLLSSTPTLHIFLFLERRKVSKFSALLFVTLIVNLARKRAKACNEVECLEISFVGLINPLLLNQVFHKFLEHGHNADRWF